MRGALLPLILALMLSSCAVMRDASDEDVTAQSVQTYETSPVASEDTADTADTAESTAEEDLAIPSESVSETDSAGTTKEGAVVGLYDDIGNSGNYTRLDTWTSPWKIGVDIAVFDVIPSDFDTISASVSYKELWRHHALVLGEEAEIKPHLILEYTTDGGAVHKYEIKSPSDAEAVIAEGYLEVYLYDDVHQADGAWYSHLTEHTVTDDTVISSVKLTGGAMIDSVSEIRLTACIGDLAGGTTELFREN